MKRFLSVIALIVAFTASAAAADARRRVAVLDFDYATVQSYVDQIFGSNVDVGRGIRDLLVEKLVQDGTFSVIERAAIDQVLQEQNFSNSNRANPNSAAQIGKILGVDAIIIGSITQFGRDDQKKTFGGGGFGGFGRTLGIGGVSKKKSKAVVGVSARIVDVNTAEILGAATGKGESKREGTSLVGAGRSGGAGGGGAADMNSSNFHNTILGEAVNGAVESTAEQLIGYAGRVPEREVKVEGLVADYTNGIVILNVGTKDGVQVGDRLVVKHPVREVRDPETGKVIHRVEKSLGEVSITDADENSAVGNFSGDTAPQVGDVVRTP